MTNDTLSILSPDTDLWGESPKQLYAFLRERIARYTMGDSSSVPVDTARRLLEGILYSLDLCRRMPPPELSANAPLSERVQAGSGIAKRIAKRAKLLLYEAKRMQPPVVNRSFSETLAALPIFFRAYDADFFPQEIPCSFDYPLCHPVEDALLGAEYMLSYLRRWLVECSFLRAFSASVLQSLYERYYVDYYDLLVNLYLPAAEMATLCALAEKPVCALALSGEELSNVNQYLYQPDTSAVKTGLLSAVDRALVQIGKHDTDLQTETQQTALDLLVRLRAASCEPT